MTTKQEILLTIEEMINHLYFLKTQIEHLEPGREKKLTGWINGAPELVGEYETHVDATPHIIQRRWWNGKQWSNGYEPFFDQQYKDKARSMFMPERYNYIIRYRGFTTKQE